MRSFSWTGKGSLGMLRTLWRKSPKSPRKGGNRIPFGPFSFLRNLHKKGSTFPLGFTCVGILWGSHHVPQAYLSRYWGNLTDRFWSPLLELFKANGWQANPLVWREFKVLEIRIRGLLNFKGHENTILSSWFSWTWTGKIEHFKSETFVAAYSTDFEVNIN